MAEATAALDVGEGVTAVGAAVGLRVCDAVALCVGVPLKEGVGVGEGEAVALFVGVGVALGEMPQGQDSVTLPTPPAAPAAPPAAPKVQLHSTAVLLL